MEPSKEEHTFIACGPKEENVSDLTQVLREINGFNDQDLFQVQQLPNANESLPDLSSVELNSELGEWSVMTSPMSCASPETNTIGRGPYLVILDQPIERCRFRYRAEQGPHGSLRGMANKKQKSCPKVKLENYNGTGYVVASLFTNEPSARLHVNDLWGNSCKNGTCMVALDVNGVAAFPNLGIMRQKEKEVSEVLFQKYVKEAQQNSGEVNDQMKEFLREKATREQITMKDCLHCVRIGFQAFLTDQHGQRSVTPVVMSDPICNSQNPGFTELRIGEIDKSKGSCAGGETIWMRCAAKVRRDQIRVKFHEPATGWEAEGVFTPNEVFEQILIIFKTPAYRDQQIEQPVHVNIHLYRTSDSEYSPPITYVYMPTDDGPPAKRPRLIPTYGPDSFGYFPSFGQYTSSPQQGPSASPEIQAYMPSSGYDSYTAMGTDRKPEVHDPDDKISLTDLKMALGPTTNQVAGLKLHKILAALWATHLDALWQYCAESDAKPFVAACRHLIGFQDQVDGSTVMHMAARTGNTKVMKTLLNVLESVPQRPSVVNARDIRGQTPLHIATRGGHSDCVHWLIQAGAERTLVDKDGNTAAHYLADTHKDSVYRKILFPTENTVASKQMIDLGLLNNAGCTPVHLSVTKSRPGLLETLIEAGAPLDVPARNTGKTALYMAVQEGDQHMTQLLLQNEASVDTEAMDGSTPLHVAVLNKHEPIIVQLLTHGAKPTTKTAHWTHVFEQNEEENYTLDTEIAECVSALDIAEGNERLTRLLDGETLDLLLIPSGCPNRDSCNGQTTDAPIAQASPLDELHDDLGSLDYIKRVRLSKLLDEDEKWEQLASSLHCEHMVGLIRVCAMQDTVSPTLLFLDQYEQIPNSKLSVLANALEKLGISEGKQLIGSVQ